MVLPREVKESLLGHFSACYKRLALLQPYLVFKDEEKRKCLRYNPRGTIQVMVTLDKKSFSFREASVTRHFREEQLGNYCFH
jgi:hypothetical protein